MVFKNVARGKSLAAGATHIGALVGVGAFVLDARRIVGEAASTVLAGKGALSGVLAHVALELRGGAKAFVTDSRKKCKSFIFVCVYDWTPLTRTGNPSRRDADGNATRMPYVPLCDCRIARKCKHRLPLCDEDLRV